MTNFRYRVSLVAMVMEWTAYVLLWHVDWRVSVGAFLLSWSDNFNCYLRTKWQAPRESP